MKKKPNPKKDKSARRVRNPLNVLGYAPNDGRKGYFRKVEQCKKCTLRSAVTDTGLCAQCK